MEQQFSFEQLPTLVSQLIKKTDTLTRLLTEKNDLKTTQQADKWFGLDELVKYDPAKRTKATWYGIVSRGEVPHHKNGKHLVFLKSEIDDWLRTGKRKSNAEIEAEAETYLFNNKNGLK